MGPEALVLVPGLMVNQRLYEPQLPALCAGQRAVMVADHTRDDSIAAIAARLLGTAPPRFALAGLSMGGYIAMEVMRQAPERVTRLALLDTTARADTPESTARRTGLMALASAGEFERVIALSYPPLVHRDRVDDAALRQIVRQMALELGPEIFVRQQRAILGRVDSRPSLTQIRIPTWVLVGEGDQLTPPALAEEMAAAISNSSLHRIADCGHLCTLEKPEAVTALLQNWLTTR